MAQGFKQRANAAKHKARQARNHAGNIARERREDTDRARVSDGARSGKAAARRRGPGPVAGMEAAGCARRSGMGSPLVASSDPNVRLARAERADQARPPTARSQSCLAPVAGCDGPTAQPTPGRQYKWGKA
jgi:hypothetical protein